MVSLSSDTKDALARDVPEPAHCRAALLAGLSFYGGKGEVFTTQRNAVARLFRTLMRGGHIEKIPGRRLMRTPVYRIAVAPAAGELGKPVRRCDRVMEGRAAFLAVGSLSAAAHGYHLEFVAGSQEAATRLTWILRSLGLTPKTMRRKGHPVLYFKDFEAIVQFLTEIGSHGAVLRLEDLHALKETKNRIHRLVNTEAANLERTAAAAAASREVIEFLSAAYGLHRLSPALREIAALRLRHPDESLAELGRRCNPPIAKATVNSRIGALNRLARQLRKAPQRGETLPRARKD
ncbi:MAG TPA: DNA-binding protein WhiA [Candidatus Baltobacteraceae bacterium]|nr:DNA-binding protein WhiA [Candidatus Baltobacteraceae bacterium]